MYLLLFAKEKQKFKGFKLCILKILICTGNLWYNENQNFRNYRKNGLLNYVDFFSFVLSNLEGIQFCHRKL